MTRALSLFGAIAVRPAILPLLPGCEAALGVPIAAKWELNPAVKKQIEAGEAFDVVITNPHLVSDLVALGKVRAGTQMPFGRIAMGVAAGAGGRTFELGSVAAFTRTLQDARSIAYAAEGSSGGYFAALLERLGIADEVGPKLVPISGGSTAAAVGRGDAEIGVIPITSILAAAPEVALAGRFPAELQSYIEFDIGISSDCADAEAAHRLSLLLASGDLDAELATRGIERR